MWKKLLTICAMLWASCAFADVDANLATLAELDAVKGIGPALSQRILAQRDRAPFVDWADLMHRVHGIGNASAARFSAEGLNVNGKPFPASPPALPGQAPASVREALEKPDR